MKDEIKSDLFGTHQFRKKQRILNFDQLSNLFYSDNPFLKANFMDEIDSYFKKVGKGLFLNMAFLLINLMY